MTNRPIRARRTRRRLLFYGALAVVVVLIAIPAIWVWHVFEDSRPRLRGRIALAGLASPVDVARDIHGVVTLTATNRQDLARALGFLHGQERFFEMDLLRRVGAGELSGLVGAAAISTDRAHRLHRFRARAEAILARMPPEHQAMLGAYAAGVNAGLAALKRAPFEYTLLRTTPVAWRPEDTLLVIYAMYFDLQDSTGWAEQRKDLAVHLLGAPLANYLYPPGTPVDVPLDGSTIDLPPMPETSSLPGVTAPPVIAPDAAPDAHGSNAFAVAGRLTGSGSAIVANDMHLHLGVPNIWYRTRMRLEAPGTETLDLDGLTLPGTPMLVTGSNGHVVWGFTDSYIRTGDLVIVDPVPGDTSRYQTPSGPQLFQRSTEQICPLRAACVPLSIEETIWGPVVTKDAQGRKLVWRWSAQDANAIRLDGMLALESAKTVREALDAAHDAGMPQQNFVVGDRDGHIGWTIIGPVPKRVGLTDEPQSWADGSRGWQGYLAPGDVPEIVDPPGGRIWTANNRIVGGEPLQTLGDGGYAEGDRARQIEQDLNSRDRFDERALLSVELDTRAAELDSWQTLLVKLIQARSNDPAASRMLPYVESWGGAAVASSVGYRLVRSFQEEAIRTIFAGFCGPLEPIAEQRAGFLTGRQANWPSLQLMTHQPSGLVPPPFKTWEELDGSLIQSLEKQVDREAGGALDRFAWGARNRIGIHHPLSPFVPLLGWLMDPRDRPIDGDTILPHVTTPGFGASERMVISPGHEADAIFEMPVGNGGNPAAPYFLSGTDAWVNGDPTPFLPGLPHWRLTLVPG